MKHVPERLIFCSCDICLRPDEEQIQRIKARSEAFAVPHDLARVSYSRGKRHGEAQWQKNSGKAMDVRRGSRKNKHASIMLRWRKKRKVSRSSESSWTEDHRRHLDYLTMIDISYSATWHQRNRYETLSCWYPMMMIGKLDRCEREKIF